MKHYQKSQNLAQSANRTGLDRKTARKLLDITVQSPEETPNTPFRAHKTRPDPFTADWFEITSILAQAPELEAKALFDYVREHLNKQYHDGQLRTFQRKVKIWRAQEGLAKEVMFSQIHFPGRLSSSDFTHMNSLEITIMGKPFIHMLYHFILTYSNWEHVTICFSETFESFQTGFQNAAQSLGGITPFHRTDSLSAAIKNSGKDKGKFTDRYKILQKYYGFTAEHTNANCGHENGDIEQSHNRLKMAVHSQLLLRGFRDFASRQSYNDFLQVVIKRRNKGRVGRFLEECDKLQNIPLKRIDDFKSLKAKVSVFSTITVDKKFYSVPSRLIGENVNVRVYSDFIEIWYADKCQEKITRIKTEKGRYIQYPHVIDSLIRKPGAFNDYVYKEDLFPSTIFRISYDRLTSLYPSSANKQYVQILHLAAHQGEEKVEGILRQINTSQSILTFERVEALVLSLRKQNLPLTVEIEDVRLEVYDSLFSTNHSIQLGGENVE
jgi:hypothetical protein